MAKLNPDMHVLLDGAAKVYLRSNTKRWQATLSTRQLPLRYDAANTLLLTCFKLEVQLKLRRSIALVKVKLPSM